MLFKTSNKIFIHLDCDSFFASCEIIKNPNLKWKYVCVWWEIIIACTYNCKALWIKVWTPVWQAREILKDKWVFLWVDHAYYSQVSKMLFEYLKPYCNVIEIFSIDEAFCDITWLPEYFKMDLSAYLKTLQKNILKDLKIPVSIGCAETRIKAKIYSKINKPFGIYIWFDKEKEIELFKNLELNKIPFVWRKSCEKLKYKAKNIYEFLYLWFWQLKNIIWKNATDLWLELSGVNAFNPRSSNDVKSISRSRSFNKNINNDIKFLHKELNIHFNYVFEEIIEKNLEIKCVSLLLRTKEFETLYFTTHLKEYSNNRNQIHYEIISLLENNFDLNKLYRSVWVVFSDFKSFLPRQTSIFDTETKTKQNNFTLYKTINKINSKYAVHKVWFWTEILWVWSDVKLKIMG